MCSRYDVHRGQSADAVDPGHSFLPSSWYSKEVLQLILTLQKQPCSRMGMLGLLTLEGIHLLFYKVQEILCTIANAAAFARAIAVALTMYCGPGGPPAPATNSLRRRCGRRCSRKRRSRWSPRGGGLGSEIVEEAKRRQGVELADAVHDAGEQRQRWTVLFSSTLTHRVFCAASLVPRTSTRILLF